MAWLQTWILLICFTLTQCASLTYDGLSSGCYTELGKSTEQCKYLFTLQARNPLVLPERHPNIHLYLEEESTGNYRIPEFASSQLPQLYSHPLTPDKMEELYLRLLKQPNKFSKYFEYTLDGNLKSHWKVPDGKKCCGNEWADYGALGRRQHNEVTKPVFQLGYGYPSNQIQEYRYSDVKPVMEHIEGDLKYDFRTNMHSL